MIIERIQNLDIQQCLDLYNYYIRNTTVTFEEKELTLEEFTSRIKRIEERYSFLVAKEGGIVLGYAYLDQFSERSAFRYTADLSVYLRQDFCHHGIGKQLLSAIESEARLNGIRHLVSVITSENIPSVKFHSENGFVKEGELHDIGFKFNRILSVVYYRKAL